MRYYLSPCSNSIHVSFGILRGWNRSSFNPPVRKRSHLRCLPFLWNYYCLWVSVFTLSETGFGTSIISHSWFLISFTSARGWSLKCKEINNFLCRLKITLFSFSHSHLLPTLHKCFSQMYEQNVIENLCGNRLLRALLIRKQRGTSETFRTRNLRTRQCEMLH